jgi:hypothetical protein
MKEASKIDWKFDALNDFEEDVQINETSSILF